MGTPPLPRLRDWLRRERGRIDAVVFDIDGVLIRHRRALPGAQELLSALREAAMPYTLLTNDGSNSPAEKADYLRAAGIDVREEEILSSGHVLRDLVARGGLRGETFFVMGKLGLPCYAEAAGLVVSRDLESIESARGIIIGEGGYDWEPTINASVNFLIRDPSALLVCPNPDSFYPIRDGRIRLASGAVAELIRRMVEPHGRPCSPIYLGKPHEEIFAANHARLERMGGLPALGLARDRVLMVGDSLTGDIAGGRAFGYRTALVLSGLTTHEMLGGSAIEPEAVFEGL